MMVFSAGDAEITTNGSFFLQRRLSQQTLKSWEARGREGVRQEALEVFRAQLEEDWAQGREPLGFPPPHRAAIGHGSSSLEEPSSCVLYVRAIAFVGYKERADS